MHTVLSIDIDAVNPQGAWLADNPWAIVLLAIAGLALAPLVIRFLGRGREEETLGYPLLVGGPHHGEDVRRDDFPLAHTTSDGHRYVRNGDVYEGHPVYEWDDPDLRG